MKFPDSWRRPLVIAFGLASVGFLLPQACGAETTRSKPVHATARPAHAFQDQSRTATTSTPHPLSIDEWREKVRSRFTFVVGDLETANRVAVVVIDEHGTLPGPPLAPYDAEIVTRVVTGTNDPVSEAGKLREALGLLSRAKAHCDVWAEGIAGLLVREAVERGGSETPPIKRVVLVDTPNRGLSTAGWPLWSVDRAVEIAKSSSFAVTGSAFLVELNSEPTAKLSGIEYLNVWRDRDAALPRSTVMQLPRAALLVVLRPLSDDSIWSVIGSEVVAARRVPDGGAPVFGRADGPTLREQDIARRAPRAGSTAIPSFAALLDNSVSELIEVSPSWFFYRHRDAKLPGTRGPPVNPFERMTDAIAVGYDPRTRNIIITGFEDFSREPLHPAFFVSALRSFHSTYPGISIDPPTQADDPGQAPVRYVGETRGTQLGGLMFEADRAMKTLALGKDNITASAVGSSVSGHRSVLSLPVSGASNAPAMWRLWFEPERWHARQQGPFAAVIDARVRCRWELMTPGSAPSQSVVYFTGQLTGKLPLYSREQPAFDELEQAAVLVAMARWTYEANLNLADRPKSAELLPTPSHTPLVQVERESVSGPYQIVEVLRGGVILGTPLRHVRDEGSRAGQLMAAALQSIPKLEPGVPSHAARPPSPRAKAATPPQMPRPPTVSWGFSDNDFLMTAVAFPAVPRDKNHRVGNYKESDQLSDPAISSDQLIYETFPIVEPVITSVFTDDAAEPPQVTLTGERFGKQGQVLFNGEELQTLKWAGREIVVAFPATPSPGTLFVRTAVGDSNAVRFMVMPGTAVREPPRITITNHTPYTMHIEIRPSSEGSNRSLDLPSGATSTIRVLPGRYAIVGRVVGSLILGATSTKDETYERGYAYSITYEASSFSLGRVEVDNETGSTLSVSVGGQMVQVMPGGVSTIQLPFGHYKMSVGTRCGAANENVTIAPNSVPRLTYKCVVRYR